MTAAIELTGITKRFPGVIANDNVNLTVQSGEIHAICGENGAGKSTLMKILYGMQAPDEGVMRVRGQEVQFDSPTDAIAAGIGMVHQHFMLADQLTVLDNIILGSEPMELQGEGAALSWWQRAIRWLRRANRIDFDEAHERLTKVTQEYGLNVDLDRLVETLEVGERQRVEIIKVLYRGADVLILDEPTAVLVPQEVEELFRNLRELKAQGSTIIFIDHKLNEVLEISDSITVLRRGKTIATVAASDVTAGDLAELMVGSELPTPDVTDATPADAAVALSVDQVTILEHDRPVLDNVSFQVREGEIGGIAGIEGNGQGHLVDAIMGTIEISHGSISMFGREIAELDVRSRREGGLAYVPADRHEEGLLLDAPLWENAALGHQTQEPFSKGWLIDRAGSRTRTEEIRADYDVRTPSVETSARALSGGNQQKLIIGREMASNPKVLIAAHPTRGIDVGAQAEVWNAIREARRNGLATILISADLDELIGLSDVIVVMYHGQLVATLDPGEITPRILGSYMTGAALGDT